ncbi:BON domain-containing protein [Bordetella bronchialis]|uniref:Phospholipid-binding protein n=1 Tax=Bordetella bronchialis TaxID=463025 RepID=A0ABM6CXG0_9BORD|nr:BON domain-containing protein [Bordetella bronchialis]ANN67967.1 phospholipid-binding protein [Bordetella bronchialis]
MRTRQILIAALLGLGTAALPAAHAADNADTSGKQKQSVGEYASDTVVTTKVKAAIVADKSLSALDIAVETNNGVVTLTGTVASAAQSDTATHVARGVEGVKQVRNNLKVDASKSNK